MVGDSDRDLTPEDTTKFTYMEQVLKETLRMYPIIAVFTRQLLDDIKLGEFHYYVSILIIPFGEMTCISRNKKF